MCFSVLELLYIILSLLYFYVLLYLVSCAMQAQTQFLGSFKGSWFFFLVVDRGRKCHDICNVILDSAISPL